MLVLYDLSRQGYKEWWLLVMMAFFAAFFVPLILFGPEFLMNAGARRLGRRPFAALVLASLTFASGGILVISVPPYLQGRAALRSGRIVIADDVLKNFDPGNRERPVRDQQFDVGSQHFIISWQSLDAGDVGGFHGFSDISTPDVPNPNGRRVRISFINPRDPQIVKVEAWTK